MERSALPVFLSVPYPAVNGITTYSIYLARGLARLGYPARILLTEADTTLASYAEQTLAIPGDVAVERLAVGRLDGWGAHWGALIRRLEESAPCVYVPNSDFRHSVVSPALSGGVIVVGVAHADEPLHYDHVARLGRYWNRIVCVSGEVAARLRERQPELSERIVAIRNGIEVPQAYPEGRRFEGRLELVYHGSFKQQQKRVLEFPALLRAVRGRGVEARLTLIGSGPDEGALREAGRELVAEGVLRIEGPMANEALRERLREFHVYVLNSEFEGMPQALLEAMSQGCVPVVTDVSSGTREVVEEGESGFLVGVSDFGAFAERIAALDADRGRLARMSRRAHAALGERGLRLADMAGRYDALFGELVAEQRAGGFVREAGPIGAPPGVVGGLSVFPLELPAHDARYGRFPSWGDVEEFEWERFCQGGGALARAQAHPVWLALRDLGSGYATELALELGEALRGRGFDARLVCLRPPPPHALRAPAGLPVETVCGHRDVGWAGAAARTLRWLESRGAASYVAFDRDAACLAPRLGPALRTLALANGCDVEWLHASGIARHLDGLVLTSPDTEARAFPDAPPAALRVSVVPFAVHGRATPRDVRRGTAATFLIYLGHLDALAPDLAAARAVLDALAAAGVASLRGVLTTWPEALPAARAALAGLPDALCAVVPSAGRRALAEQLAAADFLLVPVAFPDISLVLLDALAQGCLPVGVRSPGLEGALPETLASELVPVDHAAALAERVLALAHDLERLSQLAERTRQQMALQYPGEDAVAERWLRILARVWQPSEPAAARRAPGPLFPPYADLSDPASLAGRLVQVAEVGAFAHWYEWVEFRTRALLPRRLALALARRIGRRAAH